MRKGKTLRNILCADRFYMVDEAMKSLESVGNVLWADCKSEDELVEKTREADPRVIVSEYARITCRVMNSTPALRGIVVWGTGYDHIDVETASNRGVYVSNTRGSNAESVAEHVFALILGLSRRLLRADFFVRKGGWTSREEARLPRELTAQDLCKKTLGIVGLGVIGSYVARIARGFDMSVLAYDPYISAEYANERKAELVSLEKLLVNSDFVTLHVVLTKETRCMIDARELNLMKPTACLINASRGAVVKEESLVEALRNRKIAGAGLDVFAEEPVTLGNPLLKFDNVIVTPHNAGNSIEALEATSLRVSEEVVRILRNQVPKYLVNKSQLVERGYLS